MSPPELPRCAASGILFSCSIRQDTGPQEVPTAEALRQASLASRAWQLILDPEYKDHDLLDKEGQRQARQRITLLVHRENLALQDVDRDGHCQYHAFREAARNAGHTVTDWSTDNLRNTVVAGARGILGALGDAYAAEVENEAAAGVGVQNVGAAAWGDEGSITVLARAYLVRVRVLDERSGYVDHYGPAVPQAGKRGRQSRYPLRGPEHE